MKEKLRALKARLAEINDLESAAWLLEWDQMTYMPPGGAEARARQVATLQQLAHERRTDPELGRLLDDLAPYARSLPYDSDAASLVRVVRRDFEQDSRIPPSFMAEMHSHLAKSFQAWTTARPANDFSAVRPYLEKTLDLSRRYSGYFPDRENIADPLINRYDYGMKASLLHAVFADLRAELVPLVQAITAQPLADDSCLRQHFPEKEQWDFGLDVATRLGYDLARGRQDKSAHPFTTFFSIDDVRITVRCREDYLGELMFGSMHEGGHAMYEQGISPDLERTPLAISTSAGVDESQSRLWENLVGRSRAFWTFFFPRLQAVFPQQLGAVTLDTFYRAINKVERSLIRTEADEVTYNLHVMLRFDLELDLLEGKLAVRDLPEAWRERMKADLGIAPPDDRDGVLQDVHWYLDLIGGTFQGYTLGNIMGAQFFEAALQAHPEIPSEMAKGEFGSLHDWLRDHIYWHGRKFTASELVERVTGGPMNTAPYLRYLRQKYGELYEL